MVGSAGNGTPDSTADSTADGSRDSADVDAEDSAAGGVLVVGQIARDLVLHLDRFPEAGGSEAVRSRREMLGGKGANQAVGMAQLGARVVLVGVVGADDVGTRLLRSARQDGLDTTGVVQRGTSALLVDLVDAETDRQLLEHVPDESVLTPADIRRARSAFRAAETVCLQLQQPGDSLLEAACLAAEAGARIVLDGTADPDVMDELLPHAHVLRANDHEARLITGLEMTDVATAVGAAQPVLRRGVEVVAFTVQGAGDVVVWSGGHRFFPFSQDEKVVDRTGAGDAFLAGLVVGLGAGCSAEQAGELAAACTSSTVQRLGGRPDLGEVRAAHLPR